MRNGENQPSATSSNPEREPQIVVDVRGPGEWILDGSDGGRPLHVYRLAPGDWLVSEVGRRNEGRGADLAKALAALSGRASPAPWWDAVTEAMLAGEP